MDCTNKRAYKQKKKKKKKKKNKQTNINKNDKQHKDVKQLWANGHIFNNNKLICLIRRDKWTETQRK